jgi:FkbM family methyltransferase
VLPQAPKAPDAHWAIRGISALLQGRLPHRFQGPFDELMRGMGKPFRLVTIGQYRALVRRGASWDENAVQRILGAHDYARPSHEIRPTDTVIDIGANIGCFAVYAGKAASEGRVLAFEPDADNFDLARRNAAINGLSNVTVERCAVSGEPGTLKLFRAEHGPLHTTMVGRLESAEVADEVPAITLKQIMDKYQVDRCGFLKMNCEGAEYGILYNTPPDYLQRIDRLALEYHAAPHEDKEAISRDLAAYLTAQGFDIFDFTDFVGFDCGYIRGTRRR